MLPAVAVVVAVFVAVFVHVIDALVACFSHCAIANFLLQC